MNNTTLIVLTSLALVAIGSLLVLNFAPKIAAQIKVSAIPQLQIKSVSVVSKGVPYPLNNQQVKVLTDALQHAEKVNKADYPAVKGPFSFDKIVIARFNASDLDLIPIQYKEQNLVFSAPDLSTDNYYIELSGGALQTMLNAAHD
jgi:hypothetical protein